MNVLNRSTFLVSRTFVFDAAHRLPDYDGPCSNLHGHRYELTVTYQCPQQEDGMGMDFNHLKTIVTKRVIDRMDHKYLNDFIPNPTAENILLWVYRELVTSLEASWLYSLELREGRDTKVTLLREFVSYAGGANDD